MPENFSQISLIISFVSRFFRKDIHQCQVFRNDGRPEELFTDQLDSHAPPHPLSSSGNPLTLFSDQFMNSWISRISIYLKSVLEDTKFDLVLGANLFSTHRGHSWFIREGRGKREKLAGKGRKKKLTPSFNSISPTTPLSFPPINSLNSSLNSLSTSLNSLKAPLLSLNSSLNPSLIVILVIIYDFLLICLIFNYGKQRGDSKKLYEKKGREENNLQCIPKGLYFYSKAVYLWCV